MGNWIVDGAEYVFHENWFSWQNFSSLRISKLPSNGIWLAYSICQRWFKKPSLPWRTLYKQSPVVRRLLDLRLKVRQSHIFFFKLTILPKNKRTDEDFLTVTVLWSNCFVGFLEELRIAKIPLEIDWPLVNVHNLRNYS